MRSYLQLKEERDGYRDVTEAVKTIQKIAAAGVHPLRNALDIAQHHERAAAAGVEALLVYVGPSAAARVIGSTGGHRLVIAFGGRRGFVGGLYRAVAQRCRDSGADTLVALGKHVSHALHDIGLPPTRTLPWGSPEDSERQLRELIHLHRDRGTDIVFVHPEFRSLAEYPVMATPVIPAPLTPDRALAESPGFPIFSPSRIAMLRVMFRQWIDASLRTGLLQTRLSELAARTVAMQGAVDNADRLYRTYAFRYFKSRRKELTAEQLEIFSAHELLR
jgi:F0F1-type ATP synthase gamma subunit